MEPRSADRPPPKWFGRPWVQAELLDDERVVAHLRVDPGTGRFLAGEEPPTAGGDVRDLTGLRPAVDCALHQLEIRDWAWSMEQGQAWGVSLLFEDRAVGTLKVDVGRGLLPRADDD